MRFVERAAELMREVADELVPFTPYEAGVAAGYRGAAGMLDPSGERVGG